MSESQNLVFTAHTANILGSFGDPFEFQGDYGPAVSPLRDQVFEQVVEREALARHTAPGGSDKGVPGAVAADRQHGPTVCELVPPELMQDLREFGFGDDVMQGITRFVERYSGEKIFRFLRHTPKGFLSLDKTLPDAAAQAGQVFSLPILGSARALTGNDATALKRNLLRELRACAPLEHTRPTTLTVDDAAVRDLLGASAEAEDLLPFSGGGGQVFMYWLYQSLNLHLVAHMVPDVNAVKAHFAATLGSPAERARVLRERLDAAGTGVLFTQECDRFVVEELERGGLFHPTEGQNVADGCYVLLRSDVWEPGCVTVPLEGYEGYARGRLGAVLATHKGTGGKFLLATGHGHSTRAQDGRLQVTLVSDKYAELSREHPNLGFLMGMDANTKSDEDVRAFFDHLDSLGLTCTDHGPTTVKQRLVTVQHSKAGKLCVDQEDYLITRKPEASRASYALRNVTVGFSSSEMSPERMLPDMDNQSDHYPVGADVCAV